MAAAVAVLGLLAAIAVAQPAPATLADPASRLATVQRLEAASQSARTAAWDTAARQGWPRSGDLAGRHFELMAIANGRVYVYATTNYNAAISTAANLVRNTSPFGVNGTGVLFGIWDGGWVRTTHQEFGGRVTISDADSGATVISHATHVAGTIGAAGIVAAAQGMAPAVTINSYKWESDTSEMAAAAMSYAGEPNTIQLSNHSYTYLAGWDASSSPPRWYGQWGNRESDSFGAYESLTRTWDQVCYAAPYYLPFVAAGNDRNDTAPSSGASFQYWYGTWITKNYDPATDPYSDNWDNGGFDTISIVGNAKNIMTVGAVDDAVSGGVRSLANATMAWFSSWGPTDDGRVKPDIVANGVSLYSTDNGDTSYGYKTGTSMATPNASGSAALLVDLYGRLFPGQWMRASTIKGLIIHTADDLDNAGPDYRTGWGLMNTRVAAELIQAQHDSPSINSIVEAVVTPQDPTHNYVISVNGSSPLRATLCWTDPAATVSSGLDNPSPRLVNDLDLRVIGPAGANTYMPYVLNPASPTAPATTGDNTRDNVEQVRIAAPVVGSYVVQVSYKGTLTDAQQTYSLLISGQGSSPAGVVRFDKDAYGCHDTAAIRLTDSDLVGAGTHNVALTTTAGDAETLTLTETATDSGVFEGTIETVLGGGVPGDGTAQCVHGGVLTVVYNDANNGTGQPGTAQDTAQFTCTVAADLDVDGDIDLSDFALFQLCFNGPNRPPQSVLTDCSISDFDSDGDVDLADFAQFQTCFNGPSRPPPPACVP